MEYAGPARPLVRAWKERGLRRLAALAADLVVEHVERPAVDVIAHIPSDAARQLERSLHPACGLARELGLRWDLPVRPLLVRRRAVERQAALPSDRRGPNVRGAFEARVSPPRVLLVDDVYTTGATANAGASALRAAGARTVHVVTFTRAVRR